MGQVDFGGKDKDQKLSSFFQEVEDSNESLTSKSASRISSCMER